MSSLQTFLDVFAEAQNKFQEEASEKLMELFKEFWIKNPEIKAVVWAQYAPYFNDGEPCVFGVCEPTFTNAEGEDLEDVSHWGEYEGEKEDIWVADDFDHTSLLEGVDIASANELSSILTSPVMEPVMKSVFGEDSVIKATRDGFDVEDFSGCHE